MKPSATKKIRVRWVHDPERAGEALQAAAPAGETEDDDGGEQPQQGVALEQPTAADQLQHDEQQRGGARIETSWRRSISDPLTRGDGRGVAGLDDRTPARVRRTGRAAP